MPREFYPLLPPPPPDFQGLRDCIRRKTRPLRVYNAEMFIDGPIKLELMRRFLIQPGVPESDPLFNPTLDIALALNLGYDMVRIHLPDSEFPMNVRSSADEADGIPDANRQGYIVHEHGGPIRNWKDFESYPWPRIETLNTAPLEWAGRNLPDGMKAFDLSGQFFECLNWLLGYEGLFMMMYDDPEFLRAVLDKVADAYLAYTRLLCDFDCIGAIWAADDMGFKTQTLVSPEWLKENIIPLHKKAAAIAHEKGKLYFLHSCGQVDSLMDAMISEVSIDAKHSFEDEIMPVADFYRRYGGRVGVLGGADVSFLSRAGENEVRVYTRQILETCHTGGGYCLGSGNSITHYIPVANFLAMLDEGRRFSHDLQEY